MFSGNFYLEAHFNGGIKICLRIIYKIIFPRFRIIVFLVPGQSTESVLQKFRKTFSLRFQGKKGSKENFSVEPGDISEPLEDETQHHQPSAGSSTSQFEDMKDESLPTEQKYR